LIYDLVLQLGTTLAGAWQTYSVRDGLVVRMEVILSSPARVCSLFEV
jgi:hypothetical protein